MYFNLRIEDVSDGIALLLDGREVTAQHVDMECGCSYVYVDGKRCGMSCLCGEHFGALAIVQATLIHREQPWARN